MKYSDCRESPEVCASLMSIVHEVQLIVLPTFFSSRYVDWEPESYEIC